MRGCRTPWFLPSVPPAWNAWTPSYATTRTPNCAGGPRRPSGRNWPCCGAHRAAQARIRAARHAHRETGLHRPTRALALAPGLRVELEHRGLLREWEPVPADAPKAGQTLGGTGPYAGLGRTGRLVVALPETLWQPLTRGVYWTNQPHLQALHHLDRPMGRGAGPAAGRSAAPPEALAERARSAVHITTTGDVLRAALDRVLRT